MRPLRRFEDVHASSDSELGEILAHSSDGAERLWAAWAIALRRGSAAGAIFEQASTREPSAGVRAHLALVLVAVAELPAAMILAERDPSSLVRASACRSLARVAAPDADALNALLVRALGGDASSDVRAAVLDGLREDTPESVRSAVLDRVKDDDLEVRSCAIALALGHRRHDDPYPNALKKRTFDERDDALYARLLGAWREAEGISTVLREARELPVADVRRLLETARMQGARFELTDLEPFFLRREIDLDQFIFSMTPDSLLLPRAWALSVVGRWFRTRDPDPAARDDWPLEQVANRAMVHLERWLVVSDPAPLTAEEREVILLLESTLRAGLRAGAAHYGVEERDLIALRSGQTIDIEALDGLPDFWLEEHDLDWVYWLPSLQELLAKTSNE